LGYHVYRSASSSGPFTRLTGSAVAGTSFIDSTIVPGSTCTYMVRGLKLENTPSGSYYNLSQGTFLTLTNLSVGVYVSSITVSPAGVVLGWNSIPGAVYRVSYENDLTGANWTDATPDITAAGTSVSWTDTTAPGPQCRFYRVRQVQ
jgi:hypothetical protein